MDISNYIMTKLEMHEFMTHLLKILYLHRQLLAKRENVDLRNELHTRVFVRELLC